MKIRKLMMRKTPRLRMIKTCPARLRRKARILGTRRKRRRVTGKTLSWMRKLRTLLQKRMTCDQNRSVITINKQDSSVQILHNRFNQI